MYKLIANVERWETVYLSEVAPQDLVDQALLEPPTQASCAVVANSGRFLVETLAMHGDGERPGAVLLMGDPQWLFVVSARLRLLCAGELAAIAAAQRFADTGESRARLTQACRSIDVFLRTVGHDDASARAATRWRWSLLAAAAMALVFASTAWLIVDRRRLDLEVMRVSERLSLADRINNVADRARTLESEVAALELKLRGSASPLAVRAAAIESILEGGPEGTTLDSRVKVAANGVLSVERRLEQITGSLASLDHLARDHGGIKSVFERATEVVRLFMGETTNPTKSGGIDAELTRLRTGLNLSDNAAIMNYITRLVEEVLAVEIAWKALDGESAATTLAEIRRELVLAKEAVAMAAHASRRWKWVSISNVDRDTTSEIEIAVPRGASGLALSLSGRPAAGSPPPVVMLQRFRLVNPSGKPQSWDRIEQIVPMSGPSSVWSTSLPRDTHLDAIGVFRVELEFRITGADSGGPRYPVEVLIEVWPLTKSGPP